MNSGRCFHASSLPPIAGYVNAPPFESYQEPSQDKESLDVSSRKCSELLSGGEHATSDRNRPDGDSGLVEGLPPSNDPTNWLVDGSSSVGASVQEGVLVGGLDKAQAQRLETSVDTVDFGTNGVSGQEPGFKLPDDAGPSSPSALRELIPEQRAANAHMAQSPVNGAEKGRLESLHEGNAYGEEQEPVGTYTSQHDVSSTLGASISGEDGGPLPNTKLPQPTNDVSRPDGVLKSQVGFPRVEAFPGAPATPDEQLRLEEAQSMQLSNASGSTKDGEVSSEKGTQSMQPPSSLSSHFTQANMEDGDGSTLPHLADLNSEMSGGQDDANQGAPNDQIATLARTTSGLRDHMLPGMNGESSRDLTLSRRPPMRIDTGMPSIPGSAVISGTRPLTASMATANTPSGSATPSKLGHAVGNAQSPPERMTTRVSSGAIRHKPVSEILGETPKATPVQTDRRAFDRGLSDSHRDDHGSLQTPKSASSFTSPDPAAFKQRLSELKEKERSKLSTVVFSGSRNSENMQSQRLDDSDTPAEDKDYFLTLFIQKACQPQGAPLLGNLVKTAHKTLTTSDLYTDLNERQATQILTKIHDLQNAHRWSLRQHQRSAEPRRPVTHWDVLLSQMKWLRTDFREERKWKMAAAKFTADTCADWVASSSEERKSLQVKVRPTRTRPKSRPKSRSLSASTPDLVHSADDEASESTDEDSLRLKDSPAGAPAAIFSLPSEMFIFGLNKSPVAEKLLLELPLYEPNAEVQNAALSITDFIPDDAWKRPIVPISKYAQGKIVSLQEEEPPRKRSRFDYSDAKSSRRSFKKVSDPNHEHSENVIRPEQEDVALFDPENKHIRDRIHTGHAFRPPSEYIMPSQSFFESRQSSQWTQEEDHELRRLVRDYAYNWSLISNCLSPPSLFHSGAERRTPWECFERWISLEGLPVEMAKINYFRAYHSRLQAAQRTVEAQQQALQQAQGSNAAQIPMRRRTTQPFSVERRKNAKHIHLIDAMRKLAKKRETALHKQQHGMSCLSALSSSSSADFRSMHLGPILIFTTNYSKHSCQSRCDEKSQRNREAETCHAHSTGVQPPQVRSSGKTGRAAKAVSSADDSATKGTIDQLTLKSEMSTHVSQAAQAAKVNQQVGQSSNGMQPIRNPLPGVPNGSSPNMTAANVHGQIRGGAGDVRPGTMPRGVNGQMNGVLPTNSHGVPHAPMQPSVQAQMQMQQPMAPSMVPDPRMAQEVTRIQVEQAYRQQQRQRQAQATGQAGSPPMQNPNLLSQSNPNMLASLQGRSSPSINGVAPPNSSATSPRMTQPQTLSSGMTPAVNQIRAQYKERHPQASPDQISRMTNETLYKMSNEARHAMQAAAGNVNANAVANNSSVGLQAPSPMQQAAMMTNGVNAQQYAQFMRSQQASQQRGGSAGGGQNGSRSVTPLIQRSGSAQGGPRPSQSPSARQVGLAGGQ